MSENNKDQVDTIKPENNQTNPEVENYKKQLAEAQSKIAEQGKQLQQQYGYVRDADTLARVVEANPELKQQLRKAYQKQYGGVVEEGKKSSEQQKEKPTEGKSSKVEGGEIEELNRSVGELKKNQRAESIRRFEESTGILSLPEDQKKEVRRKIEEYVNTFGQSVKDVPVDMLEGVLDKAHKAINVEKMVEDGKMEGMAELYRNQSASMPYMQGRRLETEQEEELTKGQKEWAEKLGVSTEDAKKALKEIKEEEMPKK